MLVPLETVKVAYREEVGLMAMAIMLGKALSANRPTSTCSNDMRVPHVHVARTSM